MTLAPAAPGTGLIFRRTDLDASLPARHDNVTRTTLCTQLGQADRPELRVGTVEHLLAALSAAGVDNVVVSLDGPEVPVFDGSAAPFLFLIDCARQAGAGRSPPDHRNPPHRAGGGRGWRVCRAAARPGRSGPVALHRFSAAAIGRQALSLTLSERSFRTELARARTFTMRNEIEAMQAAGLAQGGSLENAVVVDGAQVLNPEGLWMADEFVRHKLLDAVGDLALAGGPIHGRFLAHKTGHALNNKLLRAVFANAANWRLTSADAMSRAGYVAMARAA